MTTTRHQTRPTDLYQCLLEYESSSNHPITKIDIHTPDISLDFASISLPETIQARIKQLRERDYSYKYISEDYEEILIKDLRATTPTDLNPMYVHEAEIQALRYLHGMLLILNNSYLTSNDVHDHTIDAYHAYTEKMHDTPHLSALHTRWLAEKFANLLITTTTDIKHARKQITMARDLGILLETHPSICTITSNDETITVEKSTPIKISAEFYDKHFSSIHTQPWFSNAKKYAGFSSAQRNTWLERFFLVYFTQLQKLGSPTTPSSRWLPLPANNQCIETHVINQIEKRSIDSSFIRTGTLATYEIKNTTLKHNLAYAQIKEIIKHQLIQQITTYKNKYRDLITRDQHGLFDFYINYQTLLTLHHFESLFPYKDNGGKFYLLSKQAITEIANDSELKNLAALHGAKLIFYCTNSSINKRADWLSAIKHSERTNAIQLAKITATEDFVKNINVDKWNQCADPDLKYQIALRITASSCLKAILTSNRLFSHLQHYQRHIIIAALEYLVMGDQALALVGCKSARDRTAIFATAVKTMQENPETIYDWDKLFEGITSSLQQGHHFRSMSHHVAVVKVKMVHNDFMAQLPIAIQEDIRKLKPFTKPLIKDVPLTDNEFYSDINLSTYQGKLFNDKSTSKTIMLDADDISAPQKTLSN